MTDEVYFKEVQALVKNTDRIATALESIAKSAILLAHPAATVVADDATGRTVDEGHLGTAPSRVQVG